MLAARLAARLRAISGAEEDWIAEMADPSMPAACHELLARCLGWPSPEHADGLDQVRSLTLVERDWLLLQLHQRSFGCEIVGEVRCPICRARNEVRFAARDLCDAPGGTPDRSEVPLPSGGVAIVRALTAADHEHFASLAELDTDSQWDAALARLVVSADGSDPPTDLGQDARNTIVQAVEAAAPDPIRLDLACHECGTRIEAPFDPPHFVMAEVLSHSRTLLDDVHTLAMTYHWSESEILRLPIRRRLAYLALIEAACDRALVRHEVSR